MPPRRLRRSLTQILHMKLDSEGKWTGGAGLTGGRFRKTLVCARNHPKNTQEPAYNSAVNLALNTQKMCVCVCEGDALLNGGKQQDVWENNSCVYPPPTGILGDTEETIKG